MAASDWVGAPRRLAWPRRAFAAWGLASERRALRAQQAERVGQLAEAEAQRARVGESSGLAARRLRLAEGEVLATLRAAEADLARAEANARAWRPDLSADARALPAALPEPAHTLPDVDPPELRALAHDVRRHTLEQQRARRFWGFPTLQFGWQRLAGSDGGGPILAANWMVPLFDRDRAARLEAEARQQATTAALEWNQARAAADVSGGLSAYRVLLAAAREAGQAVQASDSVTVTATAAYRASELTLTDLLDALRTAFGARERELELRAQALEQYHALEALLGQHIMDGGR